MQPKVSIIVPVYNAELFLEECLNSLINQTLKEIEIIVVLDSPPDGSEKIAELFAAQDNRIKIIRNEKNIHIGKSRNKGMEEATGEYLGFCDADDYCKLNMYELLYLRAKKDDADVVRCNTLKLDNGHLSGYYFIKLPPEPFKFVAIRDIIRHRRLSGTCTNHIFRTDFVKKYQFSFVDTKIMIAEDRQFLYQTYLYANNVVMISDALYYYRKNLKSVTFDEDFICVGKTISYFENLKFWLFKQNIYEKYKECYFEGLLRNIYTIFRRRLRRITFKEALKEIRLIKKNEVMAENLNQILKPKNFLYFLWVKPMAVILFLVIKYT